MRNTSPSRSEGDAGAKRTQGMPGVAGRRHCSALPPSFRECATVSPNRPTTTRLARQSALPSTYEVRQLPVWPEIEQLRLESRGSRHKFWISIEEEPKLWLLKYPRPNTGEHWAEKIAAEVGKLIGVNCARVELAESSGDLVTICESFYPHVWLDEYDSNDETEDRLKAEHTGDGCMDWIVETASPGVEETILFEGRDVLAWSNDHYDVEARFGQRDHNLGDIVRAVKRMFEDLSTPGIAQVDDILQALASYALFDGLIGNMDRHHENWMLKIEFSDEGAWMSAAPSFDHASSLGRELRDDRRLRRMNSGGVMQYLQRGRGGVYNNVDDRYAPAPLALARSICQRWPDYTRDTLDRIASVGDSEFQSAVDRVPPEFMSQAAKDFAFQIIVTSRRELLRNI